MPLSHHDTKPIIIGTQSFNFQYNILSVVLCLCVFVAEKGFQSGLNFKLLYLPFYLVYLMERELRKII